jgi:hypothetical protein
VGAGFFGIGIVYAKNAFVAQASEAAEKVVYFVIPSEARNLSSIEAQETKDASARSARWNDKIVSFSARFGRLVLIRARSLVPPPVTRGCPSRCSE